MLNQFWQISPCWREIENILPQLKTDSQIGGKHGVGRVDMVENRYVGMKSRGVYETPGGAILHFAHRQMETLTMDREVMHLRRDTNAFEIVMVSLCGSQTRAPNPNGIQILQPRVGAKRLPWVTRPQTISNPSEVASHSSQFDSSPSE